MSTPIHWFSQNPNTEQTFHTEKPYVSLSDFEATQAALKELLSDLEILTKGEVCDHPVGICYCGTFQNMENARAILAQPHLPAQREGKPE